MGELLIKEGGLFHSILQEKFECNEERTEDLQKFAASITKLLQNFTGDLTLTCRSFFRKLKLDQTQQEALIFMSKYIIDITNQLSKKIHIINKKIDIDVIDPLKQFAQNQKQSHKQTLIKSQGLLYQVQSNNDMLKELNKNYKDNQSSATKSKEEKQMLKSIVESEIENCNQKWQDIKSQYQLILGQMNSFNSLRCHFMMKTQIQIVKLINRLVNSTSVDQSLEEYQDMYIENETLSLELKDEMRQKLGQLIIFEEIEQTDITNLVATKSDEKEKQQIDDFISIFTSRSNLKEEDKSYEGCRTLILEETRWTNYFLNKLKTNLHTQIKLSNQKFRELASILKYIFALVVEAEDSQPVLYSLLYVSYRVKCKDQYLIKQLGRHEQFWKNSYLWNNIIEYIRLTKVKGNINHPRKEAANPFIDVFSKVLWWNSKEETSMKKPRSEKIISESKLYQILCQVNYYMVKLELNQEFIFDFLQEQSVKCGISKDNLKKLVEFHYFNKIKANNKQNATYLTRKQRLEEQYKALKSNNQKALICVQKSMKYLSVGKQTLNLQLVCKEWHQNLKENIYRRYLIEDNNFSFVNKHRLRVYKAICAPPFSESVYRRMILEIPDYTEHNQIINLDTRRSLGWDQKLRVKMIQILRSFAFYHPDHGYLQGMNYLCENILKLTDDTFIVYYIFEHLMNNQYYGMYTGNFDGLKLRIYQFMRLIERELPELFDHFRAEKIEGEHFLLSWTITLWGETSGQLCWVLWDGFLVEGWTWWFKMILWLMKVLEPELVKMNFEDIMKCFSDLHASLFSFSLQDLTDFGIEKRTMKRQIDAIQIEINVLDEIEKEYRLKSNMINEFLKKIQKKK